MEAIQALKNGIANPRGFVDIDVSAVKALAGTVKVYDVREPHEFHAELGHIAGAELVPLGTVPLRAGAWDPSQPVVVVCRSGGRSGNAAAVLAQRGFTQVMNMVGGMLAWNAAGLPVERGQ
jgi:rhodanese-related sulfurtransferase